MKALQGLKLVEIGGGYASAYCTHLLSQFGAQVTKIEPPEGDALRRMGPWPPGHEGDLEWGIPHLWLDAGKDSVVCDPQLPGDLARIRTLVAEADGVVANLTAAELARWGVHAASIADVFPGVVLVTISPFGSFGRWSGFKAHQLNAAASGAGCFHGSVEREPLVVPGLQGPVQAGTHAAGALLAFLHDAAEHGGDWIDIAEADLWAAHVGGFRVHSVVRDGVPRTRYATRNPTMYPFGLYRCKDGTLTEVALRGGEWKRFLQVLGGGEVPAWSQDEKFRNRRQNARLHVEELDAYQQPWLDAHTKEEIFAIARAQRLAFAPNYDIPEVLGSEHLRARDFFACVELPDGRRAEVPGTPFRMGRTPGALPVGGAPRLGAHTARAGARAAPAAAAGAGAGAGAQAASRRGAPLAGLRVLDLGNVIAGPACSRMLADFGAEVIKVESTHHIDAMRSSEANRSGGDLERDPAYHFVNRGKKGITLDFTVPQGRELLLRLAARCDIVLENFAPRVMPRAGLDYAALSAANPGLIMLAMPGAGDSGPLRDIVGYGNVTAGLCGMGSVSGYGPDEPVFPAALYGDWISAAHGFAALMVALRHRDRTGEGQYVNLSQWEASCASMGREFLSYTAAGTVPVPVGNRDPFHAPHNLFPAKDGWVAIVCERDAEWQALVQALGRPAWAADPQLAAAAGRVAQRDAVEAGLAAWTRERESGEVTAQLQAAGVAATPLMDVDQLVQHGHFADRESFVDVDDELLGKILMGGVPWKSHGRALPRPARGPRIGEHNEQVFLGLLGMARDEYDALVGQGVIA